MKSVYIEISQNNRIEIVDCLKGFSIFTISLMHLFHIFSGVPSLVLQMSAIGGTGVHVFFVCSGLCLYLSYLNKKPTYFSFFINRFIKIYFPYIIVVSISYLVPWMYFGEDRIQALLSHVFLYKMFIPKYERSFGVHFWFLSTIFQLYSVFIPLCLLKRKIKHNRIFFLIFLLMSFFWWVTCFVLDLTDICIWNCFFLVYIWEFSLGLVLAEIMYKGKALRISFLLLVFLALVGVSLQAFIAIELDALKMFNDIPAFIGYTSLALLLNMIPFIKKCTMWLSKISYEYYLIHMLVFTSILRFAPKDNLIIQMIFGVIAIIIALIISLIFHRLLQMFFKLMINVRKGNCLY